MKFVFISLSSTGTGISGGDRIFIELSRNWSKKYDVEIITTSEGVAMCKTQKLAGKHLKITSITDSLPGNFWLRYFYKIYVGVKYAWKRDLAADENIIVYSSSEFWMDTFTSAILKIRNKKVKWLATWFQTAPNPIKGYQEAKRDKSYNLQALMYWVAQLPVKPLINMFANWVIVNNEDERKRFPKFQKIGKVIVLIGAVRLDQMEKYRKRYSSLEKSIDAVFQGRFHPQKGVVELIEIWEKVVRKNPSAKLVMIGDGSLMDDVKEKIDKLKLDDSVSLLGYVFDGPKKYKTFASSKLVVHPAYYDSGGMASAEAMAFGIPVVGFDLKAYKSYYRKGMIKVEKGNKEIFASTVIDLIKDGKRRKKIGGEARDYIAKNYSWGVRASELLEKIH